MTPESRLRNRTKTTRTWRQTAIAILLLLCTAAIFAQQKISPVSQSSLPPDAEIQALIDARVAEQRAVGVVIETRDANGNTQVYHAGSAGHLGIPLNGDSVFEIGSITKTFTAALLADMVIRGEVHLDDPAVKSLPAGVSMPQRGGRQITLLDLATHTSGLPFLPTNLSPDIQSSWSVYTDRQLYEFLSSYKLDRDIGQKFQYSDVGLGLLGFVLAKRAGMSWERAVAERILTPLRLDATRQTPTSQMRSRLVAGHDKTGRELQPWEFLSLPGLGALRSSANDLMRYLNANLNPPNTPAGRALALTHVPRREAFSPATQIGLGWFLGIPPDHNLVFHGGSTPGFNSFAGYDPVKNIAVVILSNSGIDITDIGYHLMQSSVPADDGPTAVTALHIALVQNSPDRATDVVATAKQQNPASAFPLNAVNALGNRLLMQERNPQAIAVFKLNLELNPASAPVSNSLAQAYEQTAETTLAIETYQHTLTIAPDNAFALEHLKKLGDQKP